MTFDFYRTAFVSCNVVALWGGYLLWRQCRATRRGVVAEALRSGDGAATPEERERARRYEEDVATFALVEHVRDAAAANVELLCRLPARVYYAVARHARLPADSFAHCYAAAVVGDAAATLLGVPWSYYRHFVIEARHGFNKRARREFAADEVKAFVLRAAVVHPTLTWVEQWAVRTFGARFPLYFCAACAVVGGVAVFAYPALIAPLFNTYTPLPEGDALHGKIAALAASVRYPLRRVFVVDGSRRSSHSNMYLYGFGKNKRIVIYDTLLAQTRGDDAQVLAALCHELGHWHGGHTIKLLAAALLQLLALAYGARAVMFNDDLYAQFGFARPSPCVGFALFATVFVPPAATLLGYGVAWATRRFEFEADAFAVAHGHAAALRRVLLTLSKENKSVVEPDPLYSALHDTHPPTAQRLRAIDAAEAKRK